MNIGRRRGRNEVRIPSDEPFMNEDQIKTRSRRRHTHEESSEAKTTSTRHEEAAGAYTTHTHRQERGALGNEGNNVLPHASLKAYAHLYGYMIQREPRATRVCTSRTSG